MRKHNGFTIIELMIVVAIIAIIAAIALPAYQEWRNGGNGSEPTMGTQGGTVSLTSQNLICKDAAGVETTEPSIPGQRWYFEGGSFVTTDANGNPVVRSATGKNCEIR